MTIQSFEKIDDDLLITSQWVRRIQTIVGIACIVLCILIAFSQELGNYAPIFLAGAGLITLDGERIASRVRRTQIVPCSATREHLQTQIIYFNRSTQQDLLLMDGARVAEDFLSRLPDEKRKLAKMVRRTVLQADERIEETLKWGNLTFVKNKKNIAFVYTYDRAPYINFGFLKATSLKDPKRLFQGTGKGMRHVKIYSEKDIDKKQYTAWVKEAVQLEEVGR